MLSCLVAAGVVVLRSKAPAAASPPVADLVSRPQRQPVRESGADSITGTTISRERTTGMRKWASRAPREAAAWLFAQSPELESELAEALWQGAVTSPALAVSLVHELQTTDPERGKLHGGWLVNLLAEQGNWQIAYEMSLASPADAARDWVGCLLANRATSDPQGALATWQTLPPGPLRDSAFASLAESWAEASPATLAEWAASQPPASPEREVALQRACRLWSKQDPAAYAAWIGRVELPEETDLASVAAGQSLSVTAGLALSAMESLPDPGERFSATRQIIEEWAATEPDAARTWIGKATWLDEAQRAGLLRSTFKPFTPQLVESAETQPASDP
ncbi:MAG: hypothetical protein IAF94_23445 [Pirellulaceae bacterium]|nr:hypothetical protein [Pirellulaceae bacterium]